MRAVVHAGRADGTAVWNAAVAADEDDEDQFLLSAAAAAETCVQATVDLALETVTLLGGIRLHMGA